MRNDFVDPAPPVWEPVPVRPDRMAMACRCRFLDLFPAGFADEDYLDWERSRKWHAHQQWRDALAPERWLELLGQRRFDEVAGRALTIVSGSRLLSPLDEGVLRAGLRHGAGPFAIGLYDFLHGPGSDAGRFEQWVGVIRALPRPPLRVSTWPVVTVFGFLARPREYLFVEPPVIRAAAEAYGVDLGLPDEPGWEAWQRVLAFADRVRRDNVDLGPRDMIDLQGFLQIQGSDAY